MGFVEVMKVWWMIWVDDMAVMGLLELDGVFWEGELFDGLDGEGELEKFDDSGFSVYVVQ